MLSKVSTSKKTGADDQGWTGDLILTKDALYQLSYIGPKLKMERETGLEPATPSLEGSRSSQLSYSRPKSTDQTPPNPIDQLK